MNNARSWFLMTCLGATSLASADGAQFKQADAIVVLGHHPALDDQGVEYETRARVERGVKLYQAQQDIPLLMTGGKGTGEATEADVMAQYAVTLGVPNDHILRERASRDTIENARLSVALLRGRLGSRHTPKVILVTSDYHIARATRLFRCAGAEVSPHPVALDLSRSERAVRIIREWFVHVAYWFVDECERANKGA